MTVHFAFGLAIICMSTVAVTGQPPQVVTFTNCVNRIVQLIQQRCPGKDPRTNINFQLLQLARKKNCLSLSDTDCLFTHEARDKCSCWCGIILENPPVVNPACASYLQTDGSTSSEQTRIINGITDACFNGEELVETRKGKISMRELANQGTGTEVLAWDQRTGRFVFCPVDYWIHADTHKNAFFRVLHTNGGKQLSLTPNHLIYRRRGCEGAWETVLGQRVEEGDCVQTTDGAEAVVRVRTESKRGFFAPVTRVGSVVVNDVVASCFVNQDNEDLQRFIFAYTLAVRSVVQHLLPASLTQFLFGANDQPVPEVGQVLLAVSRLQNIFVF